jgi:hypothetical protein
MNKSTKSKATHGGRRKGSGRKFAPPRIRRHCLVVNLDWLRQQPEMDLHQLLKLAAATPQKETK